jgi:hypothetical protein
MYTRCMYCCGGGDIGVKGVREYSYRRHGRDRKKFVSIKKTPSLMGAYVCRVVAAVLVDGVREQRKKGKGGDGSGKEWDWSTSTFGLAPIVWSQSVGLKLP